MNTFASIITKQAGEIPLTPEVQQIAARRAKAILNNPEQFNNDLALMLQQAYLQGLIDAADALDGDK